MDLTWPSWIGVVADDLERQRLFYRDVLGFREADSSPDWVHLEVPGGAFELLQRDVTPRYDRARYQVGFTVRDIRTVRAELVDRGVEPISEIEGEASGSPNRWCYFRDPEDNVFEITQWVRRPGT
jgi:catechol 2,3-dioxygenase-like lactoylglutathione lyase family enzyme